MHGIAWSKNASPDILARAVWDLADVTDHIDDLALRARVTNDGIEEEIQTATLGDLIPPTHWLDLLHERGLRESGTVLLSGTVNMKEGVDQFADAWRAEFTDPVLRRSTTLGYDVVPMAEPVG